MLTQNLLLPYKTRQKMSPSIPNPGRNIGVSWGKVASRLPSCGLSIRVGVC